MAISNELFLAILAMDSYNRGYNEGISGLGNAGAVIGSATIKDQALPNGAQAAGFYALAYDWNGQTVISYRGTDNAFSWSNLDPWSDTPGGDVWNAYLTGAGDALTAQAVLAAEFFQSISGTTDSDRSQASILLTGHSLGGGLAVSERCMG